MSVLPFSLASSGTDRSSGPTALEGANAPRAVRPAPPRAPTRAPTRAPASTAPDAVEHEREHDREYGRDATRRTAPDTPPDFAALLALLGRAPLGPPSTPVAATAAGLANASVESTATTAEPATPAGREAALQALLADTQQQSLRTMRALLAANGDVLATPPTPRATATRAASLRATLGTESSAQLNNLELMALANRAQSAGRGELLARNDSQAAGVRATLDALLDIAGTARGLAVADEVAGSSATAGALDPTEVVRDPAQLAQEFRTRLDRVIARMRDEYGHDVRVVETARSAERQQALFAQGRTTPGPIVTWTTNSAHLTGEAADVLIDGKWNYPQAYARLHEIAAEEGLNTLGMRDPGHLELRGSATGTSLAAGAASTGAGTAGMAGGADIAPGIARVASVAQVAQVASVAQVAQVARPGGGAVRTDTNGGNSGNVPAEGTMLNGAASLIAGRDGATGQRGSGARDQSRDASGGASRDTLRSASSAAMSEQSRGAQRRELEQAAARSGGGADLGASVGSVTASVERLGERGAPRVEAPIGSTAAARAESIAALREDGPARPISALTMELDGANGRSEAIRVSLRGGAVGTQVNTNDAALADRLRMQTANLQDALGKHGLESEPLRVERASRTLDADTVRAAVAERGDITKGAGAGTTAGQQQGSNTDSGARERPTARQEAERDAQDAHETRDDRGESHHQRRRDRRQEQE